MDEGERHNMVGVIFSVQSNCLQETQEEQIRRLFMAESREMQQGYVKITGVAKWTNRIFNDDQVYKNFLPNIV